MSPSMPRQTSAAGPIFATVPPEEILPITNDDFESSVPGIFVVGDVTGVPLVKIAAEQGTSVVRRMSERGLFPSTQGESDRLDVVVIGGGPAGIAAAMELQARSLKYVVLERDRLAQTIRQFPFGKKVYAEPQSMEVASSVAPQVDESREAFLSRIDHEITSHDLKYREGVEVKGVRRDGKDHFTIETTDGKQFPTRFVIVAVGRQGQPRTLDVPGADQDCRLTYRLHTPEDYHDQDLLVVGGGNSAIEAALMLADDNRVTLSYRGTDFHRLKQTNRELLEEAERSGQVDVIRESVVTAIDAESVELDVAGASRTIKNDMVLAFLGTLPPIRFLSDMGLELDGLWTKKRLAWLMLTICIAVWIYFGSKSFVLLPEQANGELYVPSLSFLTSAPIRLMADVVLGIAIPAGCLALIALALINRNRTARGHVAWLRIPAQRTWVALGVLTFAAYLAAPSIVTTHADAAGPGPYYLPGLAWLFVLLPDFFSPAIGFYYLLYFGGIAGFGIYWAVRSNHRLVWRRNLTLIATQWTLWWGLPTLLVIVIGRNPWSPLLLKSLNAWPLNMAAFDFQSAQPGDPDWWKWVAIAGVMWASILTFIVIPLVTIRWGKIYCSYICSCGALAETVGNGFRHRGPKGEWPRKLERFGFIFIPLAAIATALNYLGIEALLHWYNQGVGTFLAGAIAIGVYPFLGQRIWCRLWCPLAFWMNFWGRWSRFKITPEKGKCIDCNVCNQYCQMGIDIKSHALRGEPITLKSTPCVACAECVVRCPMEILHLGNLPGSPPQLVELTGVESLYENGIQRKPDGESQ